MSGKASFSSCLWFLFLLVAGILLVGATPANIWALSSPNIPLDSPVYTYLEKLSGFGLVGSDLQGIRPFSRAEAARLLLEAEQRLALQTESAPPLVTELLSRIRELVPREVSLRKESGSAPLMDYNPLSALRFRYIYLDGVPRNYERPVHDPGGDGVFGIGSGLRPVNPYPSPVMQRGSEGTPLFENNNGVRLHDGQNGEFRWSLEGFLSDKVSALLEPTVAFSEAESSLKLNRGYVKLGGENLELEVGKDENWLGQGCRGAITLTSNAENFKVVKLSSPEPLRLRYLGPFKYALIASRFETTVTEGVERRPWFYALKLSAKPIDDLEIGFNLGRQAGGPGVSNDVGDTLRGLIGGTGTDNSNGLAGLEVRYRIPWLRNMEIYGEFSGEDTAAFWPIVESYVAGFYIPRLTDSGRDDLRFEFFQGNQILYANGTFPGGYIYKGMPIGHSQGGATQDFFTRYSHWFGVRNMISLEYIYTKRGAVGRVPGQAVERKNAGRFFWTLPVYGNIDMSLTYGNERVGNANLMAGAEQKNQIFTVELKYRY